MLPGRERGAAGAGGAARFDAVAVRARLELIAPLLHAEACRLAVESRTAAAIEAIERKAARRGGAAAPARGAGAAAASAPAAAASAPTSAHGAAAAAAAPALARCAHEFLYSDALTRCPASALGGGTLCPHHDPTDASLRAALAALQPGSYAWLLSGQ
jgi:hypothetical protein